MTINYGSEAHFDHLVTPFIWQYRSVVSRVGEYLTLEPVVLTKHAFYYGGVWNYYSSDLPMIECASRIGVFDGTGDTPETRDWIHRQRVHGVLYGKLHRNVEEYM